MKGELWLDTGAVAAVKQQKKSLFAAGILKITGGFAAQDAVVLCEASGYEFARGLCNYTHQELLTLQVSRACLHSTFCSHVKCSCFVSLSRPFVCCQCCCRHSRQQDSDQMCGVYESDDPPALPYLPACPALNLL